MSRAHDLGRGTSGLEDAISAVVREAALLGATVTIAVNPVLPTPSLWSPEKSRLATGHLFEAEVEELDPPQIEADLLMYLFDAPGEQLTSAEFARLVGMTVGQARGLFRRCKQLTGSVNGWLFTQFDTIVEGNRKTRTYRLTDAGRRVVHSEVWQSKIIYATDTK